jgi:hypothetical protein
MTRASGIEKYLIELSENAQPEGRYSNKYGCGAGVQVQKRSQPQDGKNSRGLCAAIRAIGVVLS